ncbi:efflux RND transporter periplasmic adaptor subunit [Chitinivorax sp. B]|uniref:efflux RND transporter periplasmic adaptor subunit n=1 Tax=Chitinivorax sp. B TaxID=2502235 RepID=UPI001485614E|nr:efflux RND transporter periplasmic adaptor subunit [Chitinivorax sp. B]
MTWNARQRSLIVWITILVALLVAAIWALWPAPRQIQSVVVTQGPMQIERVDQGITRVRDLYVVSTPVSGRLDRIQIEPGDKVQAGQILARLRASPATPLDERRAAEATAAALAARSRLMEAETRARLAKEELQRAQGLIAQHMIADNAFSSARTASLEAQARVATARAEWQQAQAAASWQLQPGSGVLAVQAPSDGVVLKRQIQSETVVGPGTPLLEIGNLQQLEVMAEFLSEEAVRMQPGAPAFIEAWGGAPVTAHVLRIEPAAERKISALGVEEQRVKVILNLNQVPAGLGHGYRVDARVVIASKDKVLRLPVEALIRDGNGWAVWRIRNDRIERVAVKVGETDGRVMEIIDGLSLGDHVVHYPAPDLKAGEPVKYVNVPSAGT